MAGRAPLKRTDGASITDALGALLVQRSPRKRSTAQVLVSRAAAGSEALSFGTTTTVHEVGTRELAKAVRQGGWALVAAAKCSATLLRALCDAQPSLFVCTGPLDATTIEQLGAAQVEVLGPHAQLHVDGEATHCLAAVNADELKGLRRVFGAARLALSPSPAWLAHWLTADALADHPALATIEASRLGAHPPHAAPGHAAAWLAWAEQPRAALDVLVPVGVPELDLADNDDSSDPQQRAEAWLRVAVAHALERDTGPVFPSPRVMVALHRASAQHGAARVGASDAAELDPSALAMWSQARRALAREAAADAVRAPDPHLELSAPASAFLAQGPLVRRARNAAVREFELSAPQLPEAQLRDRALEVLRASAQVLSEHESKVVLRGYGFEITRQAVANSGSGAASFADRIGYPVVLKALSPKLRRRQELGAMKLDLSNAASVRRAYGDIVANVERNAPMARLDGVVVAEMVSPGFELRCGLRKIDAERYVIFAQAVGVGSTPEPVLCACPVRPYDALRAAELVLSRLPVHARRRAEDPRPATVARELLRLQALLDDVGPRLALIDIAPLRLLPVGERDCVVLDASIVQLPHLEGA